MTSSQRALVAESKLSNFVCPSNVVTMKTNAAYQNMLTRLKLRHFYKCGGAECSFTSDFERDFANHLDQHKEIYLKCPGMHRTFQVNSIAGVLTTQATCGSPAFFVRPADMFYENISFCKTFLRFKKNLWSIFAINVAVISVFGSLPRFVKEEVLTQQITRTEL